MSNPTSSPVLSNPTATSSGPHIDSQPVFTPLNIITTKCHDMKLMEYWPSIKHKPELIQEQVEAGLYSMKRYAFYLQKIHDLRKAALLEQKKVTEYEIKEKGSKATKDAMTQYVNNSTFMQSVVSATIDFELNFMAVLDKNVIHFIIDWHKITEKKFEQCNKKLATIYSKQRDLLTKIAKSRTECHKQWSSLQSAWKECEKADQVKLTKKNGTKEHELAFKKYTSAVTKTAQAFHSFENEVKEGNEQQNIYWNDELPQCVKEYEQIETDRLRMWGIAMENFRNAQHEFFSKSNDTVRMLDGVTQSLDGTLEINNFTNAILQIHSRPIPPAEIVSHLPVEYTRVQQGDELQQLLSIDLSVALAQRQQEQQRLQPQRASNNNANQANNISIGLNSNFNMDNIVKPSYAHAVGRAMWDLRPNDADDLPLQQGELIALLDMPLPAVGESTWWVAAKFDPTNGRLLQKGIIPSNYIHVD